MVKSKIERYAIYFANLNPTRGAEIAKTRPVVVISQDAMNRFLDTVVVCPLTSKRHPRWRSRIPCMCSGRKAEIAVDQIRTISKERLQKRVDRISSVVSAQLREIVIEMYGH